MADTQDIKLSGGDWDMTGGDLQMVSGLDAIAQHLAMRLRLFLGEWFLDQSAGVPYFDDILVHNPNLNAVRAIYRKQILETPGVNAVSDLDVSFDSARRTLSVSFHADTDLGLLTSQQIQVAVP